MGRWWGRGYAKAAASSAVELLREDDVAHFTAHIFPGHVASEHVAQKLGLHSTAQLVDGEAVWVTDDPTDA